MEMSVSVNLNLHIKEASDKVKTAAFQALKDCIVDTTQDAKQMSPKRTGNNARSINWQIGSKGDLQLEDWQGAVFSTSGYGGILETGHHTKSGSFVAARPYLYPAACKNFTEQKMSEGIKAHLET